jgi:RNase adapter protein RapZ
MADVVVITGLSGAGRSTAAACLEDLGWYVVDNLPTSLVPTIAELAGQPGSRIDRLALVVGSSPQQADFVSVIDGLRVAGHDVRVVFFDAADAELVKRYGSTRRRHPRDEAGTVGDAIERERELLDPVKAAADLVIDTTDLTVHQLRARLTEVFGPEAPRTGMQVVLESFGFKHGVPTDAEYVFDVRFLPNPFWEDDLRALTGLDEAVRRYVLDRADAQRFLDLLDGLLGLALDSYAAEGKTFLTVAIGCTGGRHRSVSLVDEVGRRLRRRGYQTRIQHRDIDRD